jgi:hypothetical protein
MPQVLLDLPDDLLLTLREQPEEVLHEVRLILKCCSNEAMEPL